MQGEAATECGLAMGSNVSPIDGLCNRRLARNSAIGMIGAMPPKMSHPGRDSDVIYSLKVTIEPGEWSAAESYDLCDEANGQPRSVSFCQGMILMPIMTGEGGSRVQLSSADGSKGFVDGHLQSYSSEAVAAVLSQTGGHLADRPSTPPRIRTIMRDFARAMSDAFQSPRQTESVELPTDSQSSSAAPSSQQETPAKQSPMAAADVLAQRASLSSSE